jgi:hypothetical protein
LFHDVAPFTIVFGFNKNKGKKTIFLPSSYVLAGITITSSAVKIAIED